MRQRDTRQDGDPAPPTLARIYATTVAVLAAGLGSCYLNLAVITTTRSCTTWALATAAQLLLGVALLRARPALLTATAWLTGALAAASFIGITAAITGIW